MKIHIKTIHDKEHPYNCSMCEKRFGQHVHLKNHIKTVHGKEKPYNQPSIGDTVVSLVSFGSKKVGDVGEISRFEDGKIYVHWKTTGKELWVLEKDWYNFISLS
jgi:hypothetical protein